MQKSENQDSKTGEWRQNRKSVTCAPPPYFSPFCLFFASFLHFGRLKGLYLQICAAVCTGGTGTASHINGHGKLIHFQTVEYAAAAPKQLDTAAVLSIVKRPHGQKFHAILIFLWKFPTPSSSSAGHTVTCWISASAISLVNFSMRR